MVNSLIETANRMVAAGRGILAVDESVPTITKRFEALGITSTGDSRRAYRETLLCTPGLDEFVSGAILHEETLHQQTAGGMPFPQAMGEVGILTGIKVDTGAKALAGSPGETVTEGLDGLRERIAGFVAAGASFAKWRAVINVDDSARPTPAAVAANAHALARYAALCQEGGLVPIVEAEVLMDGGHSLERCDEVTDVVLRAVFDELHAQHVVLEGIVLKPNMVVAGLRHPSQPGIEEVASATVRRLRATVPATVPGIAFLSGGQGPELATRHLQAMNALGAQPWMLTFSYGRALQDPVLSSWLGDAANVATARRALLQRASCNAAASAGRYSLEMEAA